MSGPRVSNGKKTMEKNPNAKRRPLNEPIHLQVEKLGEKSVKIGGIGYTQLPRGDWAVTSSARAQEFLARKTAKMQ